MDDRRGEEPDTDRNGAADAEGARKSASVDPAPGRLSEWSPSCEGDLETATPTKPEAAITAAAA